MSLDLVTSNGLSQKQQKMIGQVTVQKLKLGEKGMERQLREEAQQLVEALAHAKGM